MSDIERKLEFLWLLRHRLRSTVGASAASKALAEVDAQIDYLCLDLPLLDPLELLRRCGEHGLEPPQQLRDLCLTEQLPLLLSRRLKAVAYNRDTLDLSDIDPRWRQIPLATFSWRPSQQAFEDLVHLAAKPDLEVEAFAHAAKALFAGPGLPKGFPLPSPRNHFCLTEGLPQQIRAQLLTDHERLPGLLNRTGTNSWDELQETLSSGHPLPWDSGCFSLIHNEFSRGASRLADLRTAVLLWRGPNAAGLLNQLYQFVASQQSSGALIELRTGIHPHNDPLAWRTWVTTSVAREKREYDDFLRTIDEHRLVYDMALAFQVLPMERIAEVWWPAWRSRQQPATEPLLHATVAFPSPALPPLPQPASTSSDKDDLLEALSAEPDEELEEIEAPTLRWSAEDRVIEHHSDWNRYIRPFLQENILALVAGAFLVTALTFFAWYSWDKGPFGRTIASLLLTLGASAGTAYICRFIGRVNGASQPVSAESLFASLCVLSIPFNLLLGASLLSDNFAWSLAVGAVNLAVIPWIARWLERPFGHRPVSYLIFANAVLYLPATVARLGFDASFSKSALPFIGFALLFAFLRVAEARAPGRATFNRLLLSGHFLLATAIAYIFVGARPSFHTVALFLAWAALGLSHLSRGRFLGSALAAGLSLNALLLLATHPPLWLAAVVLALLTWRQLSADIAERAWPREVFALHQVLLPIALLRLLIEPLHALEIGLLLGTLALLYQSHRVNRPYAVANTLIGIGLSLPIAAQLLSVPHLWLSYPMALLFAIIAHLQVEREPSRRLWFLYHSQIALNAFLAVRETTSLTAAAIGAALPCAWALLSSILRGPTTRQHRTALLWVLTALSMALICADLPDQLTLSSLTPFLLCLASTIACAHRARSPLPLYFAIALTALWLFELQLGTSAFWPLVFAALTLTLSFWLRGQSYWENLSQAETCLGEPFPLCRAHYLQRPLLATSLLSTICALALAALNYEPMTLKTDALAVLGSAVILIALGQRLRHPLPIRVGLAVAAVFFAALTLAWPPAWRPPTLALLTMVATAVILLHRRTPSTWFTDTLAHEMRFWAWALVLACPLIPIWAALVGPGFALPLYLPMIGMAHLFVGTFEEESPAQPFLGAHILIALAATLVGAQLALLGADQWVLVLALSGLELATLLLLLHHANHPSTRRYDRFGQGIASTLALAAAILAFHSANWHLHLPVHLIAWLCFHLHARRHAFVGSHMLKFLALSAAFLAQPVNSLQATALGLCLFIALEAVIAFLPGPVLNLLKPVETNRYLASFDKALSGAAALLVIQHMLTVASQGLALPSPHYLLYLLVPIALWVRRHEPERIAWAAVCLAYANGFTAMWALSFVQTFQLNGLHLLSLALVVTLGQLHFALVGNQRLLPLVTRPILETSCTGLAILAMLLTTLSFVLAPQLDARFEPRFIINALDMIAVAAYLRLGLHHVTDFQRALYRIALTGCLWSLGLYLLPYPQLIPWLIALPGFFFLYRSERKGSSRPEVEPIAAIALLLLALFVYVQSQPLNFILFPDKPFDGHAYLTNAPLVLLIGLAILRLHRHVSWRGLAYLGTVVALSGLTLTGIWLSEPLALPHSALLWTMAVTHLFLAAIYHAPEVREALIHYSGLREEELPPYRWLIYGSANAVLLACLILFCFEFQGPSWWMLVLFTCLLGQLHDLRQYSVQTTLISVALVSMPLGPLLMPDQPADVWVGLLALLLAIAVGLRRHPQRADLVHNHSIAVLTVLYLLACTLADSINPLGLLRFAVLALIWLALPDKPHLLAQNHQPKLWTPLAALVLLCLNQGYSETFLPQLALVNITLPGLAALLIAIPEVQAYASDRRWYFLPGWLAAARTSLTFLLLVSYALCFVAVALYPEHVTAMAVFVWPIVLTFACGFVTLLVWAVRERSARLVFFAEMSMWLAVLLVRWTFSDREGFSSLASWDAYAILALSVLSLGARELLRTRLPELARYLYYSTQLYAVLGWLLLVVLHYAFGLESQVELGAGLVALLFMFLARHHQKHNLIYGFLFANAALLLFFQSRSWNEVQIYTTPILISVMALAQVFKAELGSRRLSYVRLYAGLALLASSSWFNLIDFSQSVWYPLIAAIVAALLIVVGTSLRVRIYLFLGSAFLLTNLIGTLAHVIVRQPPTQVKLMIGIVSLAVGLVFLAGFLLFQAKRKQILERYAHLVQTLNEWE